MIARTYRFHGYNALNFVYRKGKTARTPFVTLRYVAADRRKTYRLAVVVSKKVSKSAVVRNRIRRRLYEQARVLLSPTSSHDLVLTVFDARMATLPETEVRAIVTDLTRRSAINTINT